MRNLFFYIVAFAIITPSVSHARTIEDLINRAIDVVRAMVPVAVALLLLVFIWGVAQFILYADNEEKRSEAKHIFVWGIIALFVVLSIWGIIILLQTTFFGSGGTTILPTPGR